MGSWHYREPERGRGRRWKGGGGGYPGSARALPHASFPVRPLPLHAPRQSLAPAQRICPPPSPPCLRSSVLSLQTSPGLRFSTPAGPDVWVDLRSLAGCRLFMSVSGGKDGYLCSQSPSPAGAPKFPGGQGGAVVSEPPRLSLGFPEL